MHTDRINCSDKSYVTKLKNSENHLAHTRTTSLSQELLGFHENYLALDSGTTDHQNSVVPLFQ